MKLKYLFHLAGLFYLFTSCDKIDDINGENIIKKEIFSGYVQKGPFIIGSSVLIQELNETLDQTGRSYTTTIIDNNGNFEQKNIELISSYVQLKADGYYFNEITGHSTNGQISLYALADITRSDKANINVLTHLERARVEYLVKEAKMTFADAKTQAQQEVLSVFSLSLSEETPSESFNLTNNAELLAVSCILQGRLSTADLAELMANISADIRTDGKLDSMALGTRLINNALTLPLSTIRQNMIHKYEEWGMEIQIPDFEQPVRHFIENTTYKPTDIQLPEDSTLIQFSDSTFMEYSLDGTSCQWANLEYNNKLIVINSKSELENYINCAKGDFPDIDFSKRSLLLVCGQAPNGITAISKKLSKSATGYILELGIEPNDATVSERWQIALVINKLSSESDIELNVITVPANNGEEVENPYRETIAGFWKLQNVVYNYENERVDSVVFNNPIIYEFTDKNKLIVTGSESILPNGMSIQEGEHNYEYQKPNVGILALPAPNFRIDQEEPLFCFALKNDNTMTLGGEKFDRQSGKIFRWNKIFVK
jgi:hypothetical protein